MLFIHSQQASSRVVDAVSLIWGLKISAFVEASSAANAAGSQKILRVARR